MVFLPLKVAAQYPDFHPLSGSCLVMWFYIQKQRRKPVPFYHANITVYFSRQKEIPDQDNNTFIVLNHEQQVSHLMKVCSSSAWTDTANEAVSLFFCLGVSSSHPLPTFYPSVYQSRHWCYSWLRMRLCLTNVYDLELDIDTVYRLYLTKPPDLCAHFKDSNRLSTMSHPLFVNH